MNDCPCGSGADYPACCGRYIEGGEKAPTPEALMRSRYTAYTRCGIDYLRATLEPSLREMFDEEGARKWSESSRWIGLEVLSSGESGDEGEVEFTARFEMDGRPHEHREKSRFRRTGGVWYFVEGRARGGATPVRAAPKAGRNDPCPCGSGKKFKKCCGA